MKSVVALALFVGVALSNSTAYYGWAPHKEYVYRFESQLLNGIPEIRASQYSGLKLAAEVKVQAFSDYTLRIQIQEPRLAEINEEHLPMIDGRPEVPQPEQRLPERLAHSLSQPFEVRLKRGVVESLVVEREEPVVVTNIKKALLSQLQMDLSASRRAAINSNALPVDEEEHSEPTSYFTTEERTLVGDCQTSYTIHPVPKYQANEIEARWVNKEKKLREIGSLEGPKSRGEEACRDKQYYEITKTKNFDNCKERPIYQTMSGAKSACDTSKADCKDTMTHMSSSRYIVCGSPEEFYIREAITENKLVASPLGWNTAEKMMSTAKVSLFLLKVESSGYSPLPKPSEPKEKTSLVFEYPVESQWGIKPSTREVTNGMEKENPFTPILPKPDMHSASKFVPSYLSESELKEKVVELMKKIVRTIFKSPESCPGETDVAGHIFAISQYIRPLGLNSLKDIEEAVKEAIEREGDSSDKKIAEDIFEDILAMMGTNPAAALIKEKIVEGKLKGSKAAHTLRRLIHNIRTPTKELLKELLVAVKAVKEESGRQLFSTCLLQLADLVYSACVNPSTSVTQFPVRIFGRFCTKDSSFIKEEIIPYLEEELERTESETERLAAISALGKIGEKKVFLTLVKAVEGKMGKSPMIRSVAVYALKRLAKMEPATVRPILLALIDNPAENTQVRIAAIAILPWTQPSMAELQKIAMRSWFEPSKQVASFIYSTLVNLPNTEIPELKPVGVKAKHLAGIIKPFQFGVQYSKNSRSDKYVPYSRTSTSAKMSYVNTAESIVPARISFAAKTFFGLNSADELTWTVYTQGMDKLIDKVIVALGLESETSHQVQEALRSIDEKLNIKPRESESPAALFQLSSFGYERFYALDTKYYTQIAEKLTQQLRESGEGMSDPEGRRIKMTMASIGMFGEFLTPTDTGFPLYVQMAIPVVTSLKGKIATEGSLVSVIPRVAKAELIALMNLKVESSTNILSPFGKNMFSSGVEIAVHKSAAGRVEIEASKGQVTASIKVPEMNKKMELVHAYVVPYTAIKDLNHMGPVSKTPSIKKILSGKPLKEFNSKIGESVGIDAHLRTTSDYDKTAYMNLYEILSQHTPVSAIISSGMIPSVRYGNIKLTFDPAASTTKEVKARITIVNGRNNPETEEFEVTYPKGMSSLEHEIEISCTELHESRREIEKCLRRQRHALEEVSEEARRVCEELKMNDRRQDEELCRKTVQVCKEAEQTCHKLGRRGAEQCKEMKESCLARQSVLKHVRKVAEKKLRREQEERTHEHEQRLEKISSSGISGISLETSLHSQYGPKRSVKTIAVIGGSQRGSHAKSYLDLVIVAPSKPAYNIEVEASAHVPRPLNRWNIESLLEESSRMKVSVLTRFGREGGEKKEIELESEFSKTESQKEAVKRSPEYLKCKEEERKGYALASVCMEVRHQAASVDKMETTLRFPPSWKKAVATCPTLSKLDALFKFVFLPNLSEHSLTTSVAEVTNKLKIITEFSREGDRCKAKINLPSGKEYRLDNVMVPRSIRGVMPLSTRNGVGARLMQAATRYQEPASCRVEPAYISTFDNKTYHYKLNECSHLLFKDCSNKRPLAVVAEGPSGINSNHKNVKIYAGANEVILNYGSPSSYGSQVEIKINGEKKNIRVGEEIVKRSPRSDKVVLVIFRHKDNVVHVKNPVEGLEVLSNGKRVEIVAPQLLHNRACGLCGDLNGENTADLKSPEKCLMSKAKLTAYSYMMRDESSSSRCPGIPREDRSEYEHEKRECVRSRSIPTPLEELARAVYHPKPISRAHSVISQENQACISKRLLKVCSGRDSQPEEVKTVEVSYACITRPSAKAEQFVERARAGEVIDELAALPVVFTTKQKEPVRCSGERRREGEERRRRQHRHRHQEREFQGMRNYRNQPRY